MENNKPNRTRRAIYVYGGTIVFAAMAFYTTLFGEGQIAEAFVTGCLGVIEWIVLLYLSTTTIDRSEVLTNLGKNMSMPSVRNDRQSRQIDTERPPEQAELPYKEDPNSKG